MKLRHRFRGDLIPMATRVSTSLLVVWLFLVLFVVFSINTARAANGFTYVTICSCVKTADFVAAATTTASSHHPSGTGTLTATYTVVSSANVSTAYIKITGQNVYSLAGHSYNTTGCRVAQFQSTAVAPHSAVRPKALKMPITLL